MDPNEDEVVAVIHVIWTSAIATQCPSWHEDHLKDLAFVKDLNSKMSMDVAFDARVDHLIKIGAVTVSREEIRKKAEEIVRDVLPGERYGPASMYGSGLVDKSKIIAKRNIFQVK